MNILLKYASTNTPHQIVPVRVGGTFVDMAPCMIDDSGLLTFLSRELIMMAACVGNRAPHSTLNMQPPYTMLKETELDLRILRVIGPRTFLQIERHTKILTFEADEQLAGYSSDRKSFRVYIPIIRRIIKSRNVIFIETPSRLLTLPTEGPQLLMQGFSDGDEPGDNNKGYNYIIDDDLSRDVRNYTSVIEHPGTTSTNQFTASGLSEIQWWLSFSTGSA